MLIGSVANNNAGGNATARVATLRTVAGKAVACVADWNNFNRSMGKQVALRPDLAAKFMTKICMSAKP